MNTPNSINIKGVLEDDLHASLRVAGLLVNHYLAGVLDKHGEPLTLHCSRIGFKVLRHDLSNYHQTIAGVLHEILEDTPEDIVERLANTVEVLFGTRVLKIVLAVTRTEGETYDTYIRDLVLSEVAKDAIAVKLADLEDNLDPSRGPVSESLRGRYERAKEYLEGKRREGG